MLKFTPKGTFISGKVLYPPKLETPYIYDNSLQRSRPAQESELTDAHYEIMIIVDEDDAKQLEKQCLRAFGEKYPKKKANNMPLIYNDEADQWVFKSKIRGAYGAELVPPIQVVDSKGKKVDSSLRIGVGSEVIVKSGLVAYVSGSNQGVTCRLRGVQIKQLVEADEDHGFDVLDDGYTMTDQSHETNDELDDDIPF